MNQIFQNNGSDSAYESVAYVPFSSANTKEKGPLLAGNRLRSSENQIVGVGSEAEAEELNQSQSVGTSTVICLSLRFGLRLRQSGFY